MVAPDAGHATGTGYAHQPAIVVGDGQVDTDLTVEWDLDNDGDYGETVEDITSYVLNGSYRVGRDYPSQLLGRSTPGALRLRLNNNDNRFSKYNTSSPLNTGAFSLESGTRIRVRTTESSPTEVTPLLRDRFSGTGDLDTSTSEDGLTWTVEAGGFDRSRGTAIATSEGAVSRATVDLSASDYYIQARSVHVDPTNFVGIPFRWQDTSNYEMVYLSPFSIGYIRFESGSSTVSETVARDTRRSNVTFGIDAQGTVGVLYLDGVAVLTVDLLSGTSSETEVGIYSSWSIQRAPAVDELMAWTGVRAAQDGVLWTGTVTRVESNRTRDGIKTADLFAEGDMARLDRQAAGFGAIGPSSGLSIGVRPGHAIGNVLAGVGALHPPFPLSQGDITLGGVGFGRSKAINQIREAEDAEIGFVYERPEGGIAFDARSARDKSTAVAVLSDSPAAGEIAPEELKVRTSHRDIVNRVTSEASPTLPRLVTLFGGFDDQSAGVATDVSIAMPDTGDGATAGDLAIIVIASTVQSDGVPWLNPVGWANLRPTYDELGLLRVYAKRLESGDLGQSVLFYDDTTPAGGAWQYKLYHVTNWHGDITSGVAIAGPTGFGAPHTTSTAQAGTNDPPVMLTSWEPSSTLYIAVRGGMVSSGGGATVAAPDDAQAPDGFHDLGTSSVDATAGGDYDVALQEAFFNSTAGVVNPSPFRNDSGDFDDFDYVETLTLAVRPNAGDPPPLFGGQEVTSYNVASQHDHGTVVEHPDPAAILQDTADAATYNDHLLGRFDQDRPIVTASWSANNSYLHRAKARTLRLSDRVTITDSAEGVDEDFYVEAIRTSFDPHKAWEIEIDCSPVLDPGNGADVVEIEEEAEAQTELLVDSINQDYTSGGPATVSNPVQSTGNSLVFVTVATSPAAESSGTFTAPSGASQIFDYDPGGGSGLPRVRAWRIFDEGGAANFTFGWSGTGLVQNNIIIGLDGTATDITASTTPVTSTSTSTGYPTETTVVGDLVLAIAAQQTTDEMTAGPSGYTEELNDTDTNSPRGIAVHSATAESTSETPGNATWDGTSWHIQFAVVATAS